MAKAQTKQEPLNCPFARILSEFEKGLGSHSTFFNHLHQSHLEFLKGIRSLLDGRIEELEKKTKPGKKKTTKIEVE
ncbi:MAG: hypothetical protein AB1585_10240 [Thermodesulfobacteriota bacterium]